MPVCRYIFDFCVDINERMNDTHFENKRTGGLIFIRLKQDFVLHFFLSWFQEIQRVATLFLRANLHFDLVAWRSTSRDNIQVSGGCTNTLDFIVGKFERANNTHSMKVLFHPLWLHFPLYFFFRVAFLFLSLLELLLPDSLVFHHFFNKAKNWKKEKKNGMVTRLPKSWSPFLLENDRVTTYTHHH
jgi:hypothetical protein